MSSTKGYNGWTNYETWLVQLWLNSDSSTYLVLESIKSDKHCSDKADQLEEVVRDLYQFESVGIVADIVNSAYSKVNWLEIVSAD